MHCRGINDCIETATVSPLGEYKDKIFGDRLLISNCADKVDLDANLEIAHILLSVFPDIKMTIRPHVEKVGDVKNPEYSINGERADRKAIEGENGVTNGFQKAIGQTCTIVVIDLNTNFKHKNVKFKKIASKIMGRHADFENGTINECYVVYKDKAVMVRGDWKREKIESILKVMEP